MLREQSLGRDERDGDLERRADTSRRTPHPATVRPRLRLRLEAVACPDDDLAQGGLRVAQVFRRQLAFTHRDVAVTRDADGDNARARRVPRLRRSECEEGQLPLGLVERGCSAAALVPRLDVWDDDAVAIHPRDVREYIKAGLAEGEIPGTAD